METEFFTTNLQKLILAMYVLKSKFDFSKKICGLLIFVQTIQPIFFILELQNVNIVLKSYKKRSSYIYELLQFLIRPSLKLISILDNYVEYSFYIVTFLILIHKIGLIIFTFKYFKQDQSQNFLKHAKNSFIIKLFCYCLNFYQQLAGSYFNIEMNFICLKCFKKQLELSENVGVILIILNIITILLLLIDSIGSIIINECTITNKVYGLEKLQITIFRYIYYGLIIIQLIIVIDLDYLHIEYVLSAICLCQQLLLLFELLINNIYILHYQNYPLICAISINLSFIISIFVTINLDAQLFEFCILIIFSLILMILLNLNQKNEKKFMNQLFRERKTNLNFLRFGLIKILNNETYFQKEDLMIKILIAKWHQSRCKSIKCTFCNHLSIQNPEQCCCITNEIYKEFIQDTLSCFQQNRKNVSQKQFQNQFTLVYIYFLFDFGWIVKSIQILIQMTVSKQKFQDKNLFYHFNLNQNKQNNKKFYILNLTSQASAKFIVQSGKSQISQQIFKQKLQSQYELIVQDFVEELLKFDCLLKYLENKVMETLYLKLLLYNNLIHQSEKSLNGLHFNKQLFILCQQLYEVNKILKIQFNYKPNQAIHRLYTFFLGEIISNYHKSITFYKNSKCFEDDTQKIEQVGNLDLNKKNIHYAILELGDDLQNLILVGQSQNFFDNYGKSFERNRLFEHFLPDCLIPYHKLFVNQFLETGKNKFIQVFSYNFIMNPQHILTTVKMYHSVTTLFKSRNITFAVFLQQAPLDQAFLFVDGKNMKCTFTKNLLIQVGWSDEDILNERKIKEILEIQILQIYPNFQKVIENLEDEILLKSIAMHFPAALENNNIVSSTTGKSNLKMLTQECDILVQKKQIGDFCYFLINIVKMFTSNKNRRQTKIQELGQLQIGKENNLELRDVFMDCNLDSQEDSPHIGNLNSVNFINQQLMGSLQKIIQPYHLQIKPQIFDNNFPVPKSRRDETGNQSDQCLITYRNSQIKQNTKKNSIQNSQSLQSKEDQINQKNDFVSFQLNESSNEIDKVHQHYVLLNNIISTSPQKYQQKFMFLFSFWLLFFIVFIIIQYVELQNDLDALLSYGFMTSFYASIMGPHDLYFSMRITITAYQQMNREGFLPNSELKQLIEPFQETVDLGYIELRSSLYDQLNNKYIQKFLDDVKVVINFMGKNEQEIYPIDISFRDSLLVILQYQHAQMITLQRRESTSGKPFQVSLFANYFMLHKECEKLSQLMYEYAILMNQNFNQKLIFIWVSFNFALIIFYFYLQNFQIQFFSLQDRFVQLIFLVDEHVLKREVERYNNLINSINLNQDVLFKYDPHQKLHEHLNLPFQKLLNVNQKQKQNYQAVNKTRSFIKILNIGFLVLILSIILIFVVINIVSTTLFFNKYDETIYFYKQVLEMKLRPGNLILYRETFFRWQNFTFLTENNKLELYELVNKAQFAIQNYIQTSNTIDFDHFLIDQNFIDLFVNINQNNPCKFIGEKFQNLSQMYCESAFDGAFSKGMITTLNYLSNLIKSQQALNNFTHRVEMQYYELEGSQIISRIFSVLVNQFNKSLKGQFIEMEIFFTALSIAFAILTICLQLLLFFFYSPYLGRIMKIIKRVIYLIPFESLMNNSTIERQLKELKFKFQ